MKNRDDIRDQFSPLLDGELSPEERARVEAALSEDAELLRELDSLKRVDDLYRALPAVSAPANFEADIRERLHPSHLVTAACAPSMARKERRRRMVWPGLAAAAAVLVCVGGVMVTINRSAGRLQMAGDYAKAAGPMAQTSAAPVYRDAPASPVTPDTAPPLKDEAGRPTGEQLLQAPSAVEMPKLKQSSEGREFRTDNAASAFGAVAGKQQDKNRADTDETAQTRKGGETDRLLETAPPLREGLVPQAGSHVESAEVEASDLQDKGLDPAKSTPEMLNYGKEAKSGVPTDTPAPTPVPPPASAAPEPPIAQAKKEAAHKSSAENGVAILGLAGRAQTIGPRSFTLRDGVWYESGYNDETTTSLKRGSRAMRDLIAQHGDLKDLPTLKEAVVFKVEDKWYKLGAMSK